MFEPQIEAVIAKVNALRDRVDDHWQIPASEARVLATLIAASGSVSLCEIGASYGFSTLHLAAAAKRNGGHMHSVDISPKKCAATAGHLAEAGLADVVTIHEGDARSVVGTLKPTSPFDFVFIDAVKEQSLDYLKAVTPLLAQRAVIVTDNTTTHEAELATFVTHLRSINGGISCGVPVGNGFELTVLTRS